MRSRLSTRAILLEKEMLCQETPWRRDEEGDSGVKFGFRPVRCSRSAKKRGVWHSRTQDEAQRCSKVRHKFK
jgi:hypothetical protein